MLQLEEVCSSRVHTGQHATLLQKHHPSMMLSALPPDAAMASLTIGSPPRASTSGDSSHDLAGARHIGSASSRRGTMALSEPVTPTPALAARVTGSASTQGAAVTLSEAATPDTAIAASHSGSASIPGAIAAPSEAGSSTRSANAHLPMSTAAEGDSLTKGSSP